MENEMVAENIEGAKQLGSFIETTMGPYGKDKLITRKEGNFKNYYNVTNQAGFLLRRCKFESTASQVIADLATAQENQYGDGTATVVLLTSEILSQLEPLLEQGFHQTQLINGIQDAIQLAKTTLKEQSVSMGDLSEDLLANVVRTSLSGTVTETLFEDLSETLAQQGRQFQNNGKLNELENSIHTECLKGGTVSASQAFRGALLKKSFAGNYTPASIQSPVIATVTEGFARQRSLQEPMEVDSPSSGKRTIQYSQQGTYDPKALYQQELELVSQRIKPLERAGVDVVFVEDRVEAELVAEFNKQGIAVVRNTQIDLLERVAAATNSSLHTYVDEFSAEDTGHADQIQFYSIGSQDLISISSKDSDTFAIEIHGSSRKIGWEIQRNIRSALATLRTALQYNEVVPGGGAIEAAMAHTLRANCYDPSVSEPLVVKAVGEAFEVIPTTLAKNGGLNKTDALIRIKNEHSRGNHMIGFCGRSRSMDDVTNEMIFEPAQSKLSCLLMVSEVCSMLLRIDEKIPKKG
jgi:chaperonin GroEL (HSP60 family)